MVFGHGDVNGGYFCTNSSTVSVINIHNFVDYTEKIYSISTNRYLRENYWLPGGVDIDNMLSASAPNKYVNMVYNN